MFPTVSPHIHRKIYLYKSRESNGNVPRSSSASFHKMDNRGSRFFQGRIPCGGGGGILQLLPGSSIYFVQNVKLYLKPSFFFLQKEKAFTRSTPNKKIKASVCLGSFTLLSKECNLIQSVSLFLFQPRSERVPHALYTHPRILFSDFFHHQVHRVLGYKEFGL